MRNLLVTAAAVALGVPGSLAAQADEPAEDSIVIELGAVKDEVYGVVIVAFADREIIVSSEDEDTGTITFGPFIQGAQSATPAEVTFRAAITGDENGSRTVLAGLIRPKGATDPPSPVTSTSEGAEARAWATLEAVAARIVAEFE
jgi:hypothetical protein